MSKGQNAKNKTKKCGWEFPLLGVSETDWNELYVVQVISYSIYRKDETFLIAYDCVE
jgi:hypothetical protein